MERKGREKVGYLQSIRRDFPTLPRELTPAPARRRPKLAPMPQTIAQFSLLVHDYDEAIAFYVGVLNFELLEDTPLGGGKRWVRVRPRGSTGCAILLARAKAGAQRAAVGRQAGDRVWLFLETDDFAADYRRLRERGVTIVRERSEEDFGTVCVFADCYGNKWDLIQRRVPESQG